MSCPFNDEQLAQLNIFVTLCKSHPAILNHPKLDFFKDYLVSLGVRIPTSVHTFESAPTAPSGDAAAKDADPAAESSGDESGMETDIELDMDGVIESEPADESQEMGDSLKEVSDEDQDKSDEKRMEAMKAFSEQQFDEAIKLYNEAIVMNPHSALLFAKRGQVYLKQNKLYSCIKDCSKALELNCDSAAAYKFRGRAYRLLGKFEEASHDLCESLKIDYDEQANDWLNEVKPNAEKLRQQKLTAQRKKEEKEHSEKLTRARKAQEARSEAAKAQAEGGKFPGAGAGAGAGGFKFPDKAFITPELMELFSDPEISNAFWDMTSNPGNISKYQNNPKILAAMELLSGKMGGMGMPFMPGGGAGAPADEPPKAEPKVGDDDVGLD